MLGFIAKMEFLDVARGRFDEGKNFDSLKANNLIFLVKTMSRV